MKALYPLWLLLLAFSLSTSTLLAQDLSIPSDSTQLSSIETKDGNEYVGYILRMENGVLVVRTENLGEIRVRRQDIKFIRPVQKTQIVEGEYWYDNPYATRYFFGPSGHGLRKGEGYYQNTWVWFNQVVYGFSNNFSMGVGVIPLFVFAGAPTPIWVTPKVSIPLQKDKVSLGVGGLFATVLGESGANFGVAYGQLALGPRDRNINFGLGYGYSGDSWASTPTISISGTYRTSKKFALITENYLFDTGEENYLLFSAGGRFIGRRIAIDAALVMPTQTEDFFIAIPWLSLTVPFGKPEAK